MSGFLYISLDLCRNLEPEVREVQAAMRSNHLKMMGILSLIMGLMFWDSWTNPIEVKEQLWFRIVVTLGFSFNVGIVMWTIWNMVKPQKPRLRVISGKLKK